MFTQRPKTRAIAPYAWESVVFNQEGLPFTIEDFCRHHLVLGSTGSGKTSGVAQRFERAAMRAGFGIFKTTTKAGEADEFIATARECGAEDRVVRALPNSGVVINVIQQESERSSRGGGLVENIVQLIMEAKELGDKGRGSAKSGDKFFDDKKRQALRNAVFLVLKANGTFEIETGQKFLNNLPNSDEERSGKQWQQGHCFDVITRAGVNCNHPDEAHEFRLAIDFVREWSLTNDRTRSSIFSDLTGTLDLLGRGVCRSMMCGRSTFSLDALSQGAILLCDAPLLQYHQAGVMIQGLLKYAVLRAMQARSVDIHTRPVIVFVDECQYLMTRYDALAATTGRSSKLGLFYLTQGITGLKATVERDESQFLAEMFMNTFATRVFCHNVCPQTNDYAANIIGRKLTNYSNANWRADAIADFNPLFLSPPNISLGFSQQLDHVVRPVEFTRLKRGGGRDRVVETIVHRGGDPIGVDGQQYRRVFWSQEGFK